jgi:hypothetical protein
MELNRSYQFSQKAHFTKHRSRIFILHEVYTIVRDVMSRSLVDAQFSEPENHVSKQEGRVGNLVFNPEDGGSTYLRTLYKIQPSHASLHPTNNILHSRHREAQIRHVL